MKRITGRQAGVCVRDIGRGTWHEPVLLEPYTRPYVDIDEARSSPVPHRYLHGGFEGTDLRFSVYLPQPKDYEGRFFQHITPVPDSEHLAHADTSSATKIGFAHTSGGYFLETNGGGKGRGPDPTLAAYRANAAAAEYSRVLAQEVFGPHRAFGYAYGGSGGGFRTIAGAENTTTWDGVVPYVIAAAVAMPSLFAVRMHAMRVLASVLPAIVDAYEPGGGDPLKGLDAEQQEALYEVTCMGFPPRSWFGFRTMGMHAFPVLYGGLRMADPNYFDQFWTEPGYLGSDPPTSLVRARVQHVSDVSEVLTYDDATKAGVDLVALPAHGRGGVDTAWQAGGGEAMPIAVRLASATGRWVEGAELLVQSGEAEGARLPVVRLEDDLVVLGEPHVPDAALLRPGDRVCVDNSGYLAAQTYHRHQVPDGSYSAWDQFRNADGIPRYPQRPMLLGPQFTVSTAGSLPTGRFAGKMIVVACLLDREAFPWLAAYYETMVRGNYGPSADDRFRLYFVDNALHSDVAEQEHPTHSVSYLGVLEQALRDVSAWVERGTPPPAGTRYRLEGAQVVVPDDADERAGVQPVVTLTVDGAVRADVTVGSEVWLRAHVQLPNGAGELIAVEWDLDGSGEYREREAAPPPAGGLVERRHVYVTAGSHLPAVRVVSQRHVDGTPYAQLLNIARARVVVE